MSEVIPAGWVHKKLGDVAVLTMGQSPTSQTYNLDGIGLPFFQGKADFSSRKAIVRNWCSEPNKIAQAGSVLFSVRAPVGEVNIAPTDCCIGRGLAAISAKDADPEFLFQYLCHSKSQFEAVSQGSTFESINGNELKEFLFLYPPLPEQQKIAIILSSVDDVIEKTRAQIDKFKDLKTGMMQELLTQGIGHTEFKDSSVGRIPSSWVIKLLDEVARRGSGHTPSKSVDDYWNGDIQWVSLSDSSKLDRLYITDTMKKISQLGVDNSSAVVHPGGTVIMSRDAGIGKSAILVSDMAVSQHFMAWICSTQLDNHFLYYLLQYWKPRFEAIAMGSTIKTIGLPFFKDLEVPLPSVEEQRQIANTIKSIDILIFSLEEKKEALESTKKALMQDLLTGKVRVKVDSPDTVAA
ncbi:restriction endonuclease subunit S [Alcaligenes faecalis]|uniref:Type I restriction modification DNA specificity domain-containing protein n=1 Tax=Alcaligenes faecalis TaxID=511 RepID=A0AB33CR25_ALCFA|nr:restriction endonuclease subunit S [Alcaligenes faecalis]ASR88357.1 hypothetical protein AFA_02160 [Alcaligenes faecalis]